MKRIKEGFIRFFGQHLADFIIKQLEVNHNNIDLHNYWIEKGVTLDYLCTKNQVYLN